MRTNIEIDNNLMKHAQELSGIKTKKDTVEAGLKVLVKIYSQRELLKYKGKLKWSGRLSDSRKSRI